MPDNSASPSAILLEKIFGRAPSDPAFDKRMALAQSKMQQEMPNEMSGTSIEPTGMFGRMKDSLVSKVIGGQPVATTSPFRSITYNPASLQAMDQNELEDTLAHELTHVGQYARQPLWKNLMDAALPVKDEGLPEETAKALRMSGYSDPAAYRGRSAEMEAYGAEQQRKLNSQRGFPGEDIQLFPAKKKTGINTGPSQKVVK